MADKTDVDPFAKNGLCTARVRSGSKHRPHGCPCCLGPEHEGAHHCSCGAAWEVDAGRRLVVLESPPFPAVCGWGGRNAGTP